MKKSLLFVSILALSLTVLAGCTNPMTDDTEVTTGAVVEATGAMDVVEVEVVNVDEIDMSGAVEVIEADVVEVVETPLVDVVEVEATAE